MSSRGSILTFLGICLAHAVFIVSFVRIPHARPLEISQPTVQGVIIPMEAPPAPPVAEPPPSPPVESHPPPPQEKPKLQQPKPKPKPMPKPKPKPVKPARVPKTPPSEKAITPPPQQTPAPAAPVDSPKPAELPVEAPRVDASHLKNPAPAYPALSRRLGEEGRVLLELLIQPDGSVSEIRVKSSSGFPRLDQTALETVKRWRFVPAKRGGEPIPYWYVQPIEFSLNS